MRETPISTVLRRAAVLTVCVLLSGWSVPLAQAAEKPTPPPSDTTVHESNPDPFSLTVTPTRLVLGPDDVSRTTEIKVINTGQAEVPVTVQKRNFTGGPDGALAYNPDAPYAAANWATVSPETFQLAPGATQIVSLRIAVPPNPDPGDHQVALVFLVPAGDTTANIKVNRGIAIPIFIGVPGSTDSTVSIGGLSVPPFVLRGPVDISAELRSTGTVHRDFRAGAPLTVSSAGSTATFPDFTVMRGGTRDVNTVWDPPLLCICHPTVTYLNADGMPETATATIVVFPLDLFAGLIVAAIAVVFALRWRRKRYRAAVLRAAEAGQWLQPPRAAGRHHA